MTSEKSGKLYHDLTPTSGGWNMACDEWLLQRAIEADEISLRFYCWDQPTLSLGYFQEKIGGELPERFVQLPKVRRLSGGGAILHDQELTYSFAIPATHPLASAPVKLYSIVHRAIIDALATQNVTTQMRGKDEKEMDGRFLCFLRGDCHDLTINSHKILGSAQRRRKGAILQHGSLILKQSSHAPEVPGISELSNVTIDVSTLCNELIVSLPEIAENWSNADFQNPETRQLILDKEAGYYR